MNPRLKAVTLLEVIIVVVIMSILTMVALPNFSSADEKIKGRNAIRTLLAIQQMQRRFILRNGVFYVINQTAITDSDLRNDAITRNLKVNLERGNFNYNIIETVAGHPESGYRITATRLPGASRCANRQMFLIFNQVNVDKTGCNLW